MFVTVIHHIHDPEGFQADEAKALEAGLPSHVALPIHAATNDHELGICIWEGESVEAVREVVEGAVGPWAKNEACSCQRGRFHSVFPTRRVGPVAREHSMQTTDRAAHFEDATDDSSSVVCTEDSHDDRDHVAVDVGSDADSRPRLAVLSFPRPDASTARRP